MQQGIQAREGLLLHTLRLKIQNVLPKIGQGEKTMQFSLSELSSRVKIPVRKLRYVLDHKLLPDRSWFLVEDAPGTPRVLDDISACFVTAAALLLEFGVKRETIREFIVGFLDIQPSGRNQLGLPMIFEGFTTKKDIYVLLGDNSHVRCVVGKSDTGWMKVGKTLKKTPDYSPIVMFTVQLGKIRDQLT